MRFLCIPLLSLSMLACRAGVVTCPDGVCETGPCELDELYLDGECVSLCVTNADCRPDEFCNEGRCRLRPPVEEVSTLTSTTTALLGRSPVNHLVRTAGFTFQVTLRDSDGAPVAGVLADNISLEVASHCPNPGVLHPSRDADSRGRVSFTASDLGYAGGTCVSTDDTPAARVRVEGVGEIAAFDIVVSPDHDGDGDIDRDDRAIFVAARDGTGIPRDCDFDGDGDIDEYDLIIFEAHYLAQERVPSPEHSTFPDLLMRSPANPTLGDGAVDFAGWILDQLGDPMVDIEAERITLEFLDDCPNPGLLHPDAGSDASGYVVFSGARLDSGGACWSGTGAAVVRVGGVAVATRFEIMSPDEDGDGDVDQDDLDVFLAARHAPNPPLYLADFNGDAIVDLSDFSIFADHFAVYTPPPECGNDEIESGEACDGPLLNGTCDECASIVCEESYGDCDFDAVTGCEVNLMLDWQHCGSCFRQCPYGCNAGECAEAPGTQICGNGVTEPPEECDDGGLNSESNRCLPDCTLNRCGDGHLWVGVEDCDDGNDVVDDGCPSGEPGLCRSPYCGDGFVNPESEACDDGNVIHTDDCVACALPTCGDGFVHDGVEACDIDRVLANAECLGCTAIDCDAGFANCDGDTTNGCEANLATSELHCGACNRGCDGQCIAGSCQSEDPPDIDMGI